MRLSALYRERFTETARLSADARTAISDLQFTGAYRVPFQFSQIVRESLPTGNFFKASQGVSLFDLDGNAFYDLTGSYGVNLLGTDKYKRLIEEGPRPLQNSVRRWPGCIRLWPTTSGGCAQSRGWTRFRFTCRGPKR